jgi:hypothetical protein
MAMFMDPKGKTGRQRGLFQLFGMFFYYSGTKEEKRRGP